MAAPSQPWQPTPCSERMHDLHEALLLIVHANRGGQNNSLAEFSLSAIVLNLALQSPENILQGGRKEAGKKVLALPAPPQKDSSAAAWSCLDGLWDALCHSSTLRAQQPAVLAQATRALLGMWQVRGMRLPDAHRLS